MPLPARTASGTSPLEKILQENFITCGKYGKSKLHSFLWPTLYNKNFNPSKNKFMSLYSFVKLGTNEAEDS